MWHCKDIFGTMCDAAAVGKTPRIAFGSLFVLFVLCSFLAPPMAFSSPSHSAEYISTQKMISQYKLRSWSVDDRLPSPTVNHIAQTEDGYLWLATFEGLARFDGTRFRIFSEANTPAITVPGIMCLLPKARNVWVGTYGGGLVKYLPDTIVTVPLPDGLGDIISSVLEYGENVLVITNSGFCLLSPEGKEVPLPPHLVPHAYKHYIYGHLDRQGVLWLVTRTGGLRAVVGNKVLERQLPAAPSMLSASSSFTSSPAGEVFIAVAGGGLIQASIENDSIVIEALLSDNITSIFADKDNTLWASTGGELLRYSINDNRIISRAAVPSLLSVTSWHQDERGRLWIGTFYSGFSCLEDGKFTLFRTTEGLPDNLTYCSLERPDGVLLIGTKSGLGAISGHTRVKLPAELTGNKVAALALDSTGRVWSGSESGLFLLRQDFSVEKAFSITKGLPGNSVTALFATADKSIYVGTSNGLARIDGQRLSVNADFPELENRFILAITQDKKGTVWIGTSDGGLWYIDKESSLHKWTSAGGEQIETVFGIFDDEEAGLWLATNKGVALIDNAGQLHLITTRNGLPTNTVFDIARGSDGNLWLTGGRGISALKNEEIRDIVAGRKERFDSLKLFLRADGLPTAACTPVGKIFIDSKNRLYFPTIQGMAAIDPMSVKKNKSAPLTYIETIFGDMATYRPDSSNTIYVPHATRNLTFLFSGLHFDPVDNTFFECQLLGYDEKPYIISGVKTNVYYTSLEPGEYTFRVRSRNEDGVWSSRYATVHVVVEPAYWQTKSFVIGMILLIALLLYLLYRWRIMRLRKAKELLEIAVKTRTQELEEANIALQDAKEEIQIQLDLVDKQAEDIRQVNKELTKTNTQLSDLLTQKDEFLGIAAHDLKNPLSSIMLTVDNIKSYYHKITEEQLFKQLSRIASTSRTMYEIVSNLLQINALESEGVSFEKSDIVPLEILNEVVETYKQQAEKKSITLYYEMESNAHTVPTLHTNKEVVREMLDNIISNAVKYTPPGKSVFVSYIFDERFFTVAIKDEGPGISDEDQKKMFGRFTKLSARPTGGENSTGLGLYIVSKYAKLLGGTVTCESTLGEGSTFYLALPIDEHRESTALSQ